ncbi:UDP-N-acetylmuramoyl-L-alanyl-D-glutamate--2,6-diaminopimelate ligase [Haoranjiania flava]|uniref:UDP-N-acetylmuramoyl-L-alanyl-D-glutamate--2,6-diaminopimelate ligase n=1 Tax=Haoranjiania flava TaxID=1856322 RepID=A0AAE3LKG8_9BACT|nr:UDP-N-acetylmuramoyl-L-alanyl-D-glutamate--2,6-diaminopimelate ligase [Haoranjiania flava]MCU7694379.1 UDP-N-acetylmuramoyl-L-alanyl-D-glutamate--2,6-diaminopimelate ligase [Haoranjiania flava]
MKTLRDILHHIPTVKLAGDAGVQVKDLQLDSRKVSDGTAFIAIRGAVSDGHDFIGKAVENGAVAVFCEKLPQVVQENIVYVQVKDTQEAAALVAGNFYQHPSSEIKLYGITGTNGKTTVATILYKLFTGLGYKCGLVSTVENKIGQEVIPATHTTPDAISLNALLQRMQQEGCTHVFMECSSHAIHQHRTTGLSFAGGIFTNITHDHLDYHKTFDEYIKVKKKFFDQLPSVAFALTNIDDKRGSVMLQNTKATKRTYSLHTMADFKGKILENALTGLVMLVNNREVHFRLIGEFNAYNILAVFGTAISAGEDSEEVLRILSMLTSAEGRFDYIVSKRNIIGIVDYAHTPDALQNVLETIGQLKKTGGRVIAVVGCGGDRDKAKRPVMAKVAAELSSRVILTSDNPRSEDPAVIIREMEAGLNTAGKRKAISIADRKEAVKTAVSLANDGDIILVAGKGHEKYQEVNGVRNHFDDREVLMEMFELLEK